MAWRLCGDSLMLIRRTATVARVQQQRADRIAVPVG